MSCVMIYFGKDYDKFEKIYYFLLNRAEKVNVDLSILTKMNQLGFVDPFFNSLFTVIYPFNKFAIF